KIMLGKVLNATYCFVMVSASISQELEPGLDHAGLPPGPTATRPANAPRPKRRTSRRQGTSLSGRQKSASDNEPGTEASHDARDHGEKDQPRERGHDYSDEKPK